MPFGFNPFDDSDDDDDDDSDTIGSLTFSNLEVTYDSEATDHTFSREVEDFRGTYTSEGGRQLSTREVRNGGRPYTEHMPRSINTGLPFNLMELPSLGYWFAQKALEQYDHYEIGEAFAGHRYSDVDGPAAVARLVVEGASEEITEMGDTGLEPPYSFNEATSGWPRKAVLLLIEYEYEHQDRSEYSTFWEDLEGLAGHDDLPDLPEADDLDLFYESNPFADDDLLALEASTLILLRSNEEDDPPPTVLDSIEDHSAFRSWYEDVENVETAVSYHQFDTNADAAIFRHAAPPNEWIGPTNPSSVRRESCQVCGIVLRQITRESGTVGWVDNEGNSLGGTSVGNGGWTMIDGPNRGIVCGVCQEDFHEGADTVAFIYPQDNIHVRLDRSAALGFDHGESNPDFTRINDLSPGMHEDLMMGLRGRATEFYTISPNEEFGDVGEQREAIEALADTPGELSNGPTIVTAIEGSAQISTPRTNAEAVQEIKEAIEARVTA